eukprot:8072775-Prorocentrum_lima.AAC.1
MSSPIWPPLDTAVTADGESPGARSAMEFAAAAKAAKAAPPSRESSLPHTKERPRCRRLLTPAR